MKLIQSAVLSTALFITGCATTSSIDGGASRSATGGKAQACRTGDVGISGPNQCLTDDAACYQISDGSWCTGERGNTCPAGSVAIPAGTACPSGARCFDYDDSLTCAVSTR